jgi:translation initiation factor 2 beta subunit (eIF-2beta)/eIF-5
MVSRYVLRGKKTDWNGFDRECVIGTFRWLDHKCYVHTVFLSLYFKQTAIVDLKILLSRIKTVIPNITDVASSLHRSPGEVNKFFGTELGAQSKYIPETDKAIVNGAHTDGILQELMHRYIEKFVLCPNCRLPESEYKIKNECIFHRCKACGAKDMVDMSHKLCNYILAEDKKTKKEAKAKGKKLEKEDDKVRRSLYAGIDCRMLYVLS